MMNDELFLSLDVPGVWWSSLIGEYFDRHYSNTKSLNTIDEFNQFVQETTGGSTVLDEDCREYLGIQFKTKADMVHFMLRYSK